MINTLLDAECWKNSKTFLKFTWFLYKIFSYFREFIVICVQAGPKHDRPLSVLTSGHKVLLHIYALHYARSKQNINSKTAQF